MRLENNINSIEEIHNLSTLESVNSDIIRTFIGHKIGSGSFRSVYQYNLDDRFVIKVEVLNTGMNNNEYELWDEVKGLKGTLAWVKT